MMTETRSDALVVFGVTGDLAHKMILPSLYQMVRRGHITEPIIGVALDDWDIERLADRARDGIEKQFGKVDEAVFATFKGLLRYVSGDYKSPCHVRRTAGCSGWGNPSALLSRHPALAFRHRHRCPQGRGHCR